MAGRASSQQPRWPRLLVGAVLLWRTLCVAALANSADLSDSRFPAEWCSPGLNRSVKLTFTNYHGDGAGTDLPSCFSEVRV
jgi:hypothetical protein